LSSGATDALAEQELEHGVAQLQDFRRGLEQAAGGAEVDGAWPQVRILHDQVVALLK